MGYSEFGGFDGGFFTIIPMIVTIGFIFVFGMILVSAVRGITQWKKNNDSPVLTVEAQIVAKRADTQYHQHGTGNDNTMMHTTSSTTYYVTFQVASGDRMEFHLPDREYGMLVEGDHGKLTFQGTRYLGFERARDTTL